MRGGGAAPTQSLGGGAGLPLDVSVLQAAELLLQAGDALALLRHEGSQRRHLLQHLVQPPARLRTGHAISAVTGAPPTPPKATPTRQVTCLKEHAPSTIALIKSHAHPPNDHAHPHKTTPPSTAALLKATPSPPNDHAHFNSASIAGHAPPEATPPTLTAGLPVPVLRAGGALRRELGAVGAGAALAVAVAVGAERPSCSREWRFTFSSLCLLGT